MFRQVFCPSSGV